MAEVAIVGSSPDSAYISDDGLTDHAGQTATRSFLGVLAMPVEHAEEQVARMLEQQCRNWTAVLLAGEMARDLAFDFPIDAYDVAQGVLEPDDDPEMATDVAKVRELVKGLRLGEAEQFVEDAAAVAALRSRWGDVEAVAAALVEQRRLDREALWDMLL